MAGVRMAFLGVVCTCLSVSAVNGSAKLAIRVSPTVSTAPGYVLIRATMEADADNRAVKVSAESDDFYTSSEVQLEGTNSPRIKEFRFGGLPAGDYEVTATLIGSRGQRAAASRTITVAQGLR